MRAARVKHFLLMLEALELVTRSSLRWCDRNRGVTMQFLGKLDVASTLRGGGYILTLQMR